MMQAHANRPFLNWRWIAIGLTLVSIPMLVVGNMAFPLADGHDLTPFEVAGPPFFLAVLPGFVVCAAKRQWGIAAVGATVFHLVTTGLCWTLLGRSIALSWLSVFLLVGFASLSPQLVRRQAR